MGGRPESDGRDAARGADCIRCSCVIAVRAAALRRRHIARRHRPRRIIIARKAHQSAPRICVARRTRTSTHAHTKRTGASRRVTHGGKAESHHIAPPHRRREADSRTAGAADARRSARGVRRSTTTAATATTAAPRARRGFRDAHALLRDGARAGRAGGDELNEQRAAHRAVAPHAGYRSRSRHRDEPRASRTTSRGAENAGPSANASVSTSLPWRPESTAARSREQKPRGIARARRRSARPRVPREPPTAAPALPRRVARRARAAGASACFARNARERGSIDRCPRASARRRRRRSSSATHGAHAAARRSEQHEQRDQERDHARSVSARSGQFALTQDR